MATYCCRVVEVLLRNGLLLRQRSVAIHIQLSAALVRFRHRDLRLGLDQLGARLGELALRFGEGPLPDRARLETARVNLKKQLALL